MAMIDALLSELEQESLTTRRVLERVPQAHLSWKPHPKSMSLGQLALHVATVPGNVAELECVLRGAMSASRHGVIETQHLPLGLQKQAQRRSLSALERADRDVILETLAGTGWNKSETAKALGIARATLYRKIRVLGIPDRATMPS